MQFRFLFLIDLQQLISPISNCIPKQKNGLSDSPRPSLTHRHPLRHRAHLTLHVTAPVEFTVAPLRPLDPERVVTPPTAQRVAVVDAVRALIAVPAPGAGRIDGRVHLAVVGRLLVEQEVHLVWLLAVALEKPGVRGVGQVNLGPEVERRYFLK